MGTSIPLTLDEDDITFIVVIYKNEDE